MKCKAINLIGYFTPCLIFSSFSGFQNFLFYKLVEFTVISKHFVIYSCMHVCACLCGQRLQQGLCRENAQLMSSDVMMEHALNRDIVVTVNITVLMALMSSTVVSHFVMSELFKRLATPVCFKVSYRFADKFCIHRLRNAVI